VISGPGSNLRNGVPRPATTFAFWSAKRSPRTGGIRMADTRVTRVPAVASLSVARATAEHPVDDRARPTDGRVVSRLSLDCSSTLRCSAIMGPWANEQASKPKSRAADAAPSDPHSPLQRTTCCAVTAGLHRDATPCMKHSPIMRGVNDDTFSRAVSPLRPSDSIQMATSERNRLRSPP